MLRAAWLCLICLPSFALAQPSSSQSISGTQSSPVQVVYVIDGSTLTTYDVDPQTLNAAQVGSLTLPNSTYPGLITSPDGKSLYYVAYDSTAKQNQHIWVYATDASGAPRTPPLQVINAKGVYGMQIDPTGNFLYAVHFGAGGSPFTNTYTIQRFARNTTSGRIGDSLVEAKYSLPSGAGGTESCGVSILGFNAASTRFYDEVGCGYHGGSSATYYERVLNPQTGVLGPDLQVYSWNNATEGFEYVQFVKNLVFDFVSPNNYQQGVDSLNIYPLQRNTNKPLLTCHASMLEACGYAGGVAHPSGKYVFMEITQDSTQIDKVELSARKIVDTSYYIPYQFRQFSPDGTLVYGTLNSSPGFYIEIYGFNISTGAVRAGGIIGVPATFDPWFAAERH
jgi:hypothetical protein